ncbi:Bacterial leucyl aminopeptidase [Massilia sp. Bi118]|uniref:M20/M25/M40 family metallo-hydrolase n=1 Tax=Massilia sp. Bi118 TaxID=2822346 RepID=UPI001D6681A8|nr:M20/M25/M40 family metallo-hydrolase [Massilia sp. Bi118]CAH0318688.1 Bacterial leucyl aminopeptidase [Massilia sp. Bi118]
MKSHPYLSGLAAVLALGLPPTVSSAPEKTAWITMGDAAFVQVRELVPGIASVESRQLAGGGQKIHAVRVSESRLETIADAIHQRLRQCGGFMLHKTEAEARAALRASVATGPSPSYLIDNRDLVEPVLARMGDKNIEQTILSLSAFPNRYYKSQSGVDASNWLAATWSEMAKGRPDITVEQFTHAAYPQKSVVLRIAGSDKPNESIVLGAHLDSILVSRMSDTAIAPGADDDASGVASLTEALRSMLELGYRPKRSIHLVAYAAEEVGLRGSQDIARAFKQANSAVVGVLQLDMTNYKGAANDIYIFTDYTDSEQNAFLAQLVSAYLPDLKVGYDKCGYACSDHASWQALGFPTSMPFEASFARDNPAIHTAKDTFANSGGQATHTLKFARLAAAFAIELGSD